MKKILALSVVMLAFVSSTFGQLTATATSSATATILTPIAIVNTFALSYGNLAVGVGGGTVVLTPAAAPARNLTGDVVLPPTTGTVTAATFTVTGTAAATYAITLPAGVTTLDNGAGGTMTVDTFTSSPTPTGTLTGGTETLYVGATLHVAGSQAPGVYNSTANFSVRVDYN